MLRARACEYDTFIDAIEAMRVRAVKDCYYHFDAALITITPLRYFRRYVMRALTMRYCRFCLQRPLFFIRVSFTPMPLFFFFDIFLRRLMRAMLMLPSGMRVALRQRRGSDTICWCCWYFFARCLWYAYSASLLIIDAATAIIADAFRFFRWWLFSLWLLRHVSDFRAAFFLLISSMLMLLLFQR